MKKYFKYYGICWAIALAVFNVITFVAANETVGLSSVGSSFWVGYAFITIAFIGNLICSFLFFKEENKSKVFLNVPIINLAFSGLIVSLIVGVVAMAVPQIPYWVGVIVDVLVLAFYAIAIVKASAAADIVNDVEQKVKEQTFFIKSLICDIEMLAEKENNPEIKQQLKKLAEKAKYSDPTSNNALADLESKIANKVNELRTGDNKLEIINQIDLLLTERNIKIKNLK
ncbi:MAG: hypothetical protein K2I14_04865 [Eubacterium sp.]|nr:hypothetical protein [Eubacterium sp.]